MLEIASQIAICLLAAAFIGFIIGYLVAKSTTKPAIAKDEEIVENQETEATVETPEPEIEAKIETVETKTEEEPEVPTEVEVETEIETPKDEVETEIEIEIPTEKAVESAIEALEELEGEEIQEEEIITKKPELLDAPRDDQKDDLTQIKGIGPKVEEKLNEAGIYHLDQIANWTEANIKWLEKNTTFAHRATKDLWVSQAKMFIK